MTAKHTFGPLSNEKGSVLLVSLMLLVVLTIIGLAATSKTIVEQSISSNDRLYRGAFYAAETGLAVVASTPALYGDQNIIPDDPDAPSVEENPTGQTPFAATVTYQGAGTDGLSLRGSGYSVGKFRAHDYQVRSVGSGPGGARSVVELLGYRIGF